MGDVPKILQLLRVTRQRGKKKRTKNRGTRKKGNKKRTQSTEDLEEKIVDVLKKLETRKKKKMDLEEKIVDVLKKLETKKEKDGLGRKNCGRLEEIGNEKRK